MAQEQAQQRQDYQVNQDGDTLRQEQQHCEEQGMEAQCALHESTQAINERNRHVREQEEDPNNYVTKNHLFGVQRALHHENEALGDRIDQLATDLQ